MFLQTQSPCALNEQILDQVLKKTTVRCYLILLNLVDDKNVEILGVNTSYDSLFANIKHEKQTKGSTFVLSFNVNHLKEIVETKTTTLIETPLLITAKKEASAFLEKYLDTYQGYDPYFNRSFAEAIARACQESRSNRTNYVVYRNYSGYSFMEYLAFYANPLCVPLQIKAVCDRNGKVNFEV